MKLRGQHFKYSENHIQILHLLLTNVSSQIRRDDKITAGSGIWGEVGSRPHDAHTIE